jgi:hypothetical protein
MRVGGRGIRKTAEIKFLSIKLQRRRKQMSGVYESSGRTE